MKTLYLIDGHAQFFRAFHAIRTPMRSPVTGEPTNATFGFVGMLLKLLREKRPDYLAVAIDVSGDKETFRSEIYPEYKAHRESPPEEFGPQVERCLALLGALGVPVVGVEGFEADDAIATIVRELEENHPGVRVRIVSKDKDLAQLLAEGRVEMYDAHTDEVTDVAALLENKGVAPGQVVDMLALMGDSVDNVPGVEGIGPKTAAQLIQTYGSLDELLARSGEVKGKRGENLRAAGDQLALSRELVTLRSDAPVELDVEAARIDALKLDALLPLMKELGFRRHREEIEKLIEERGKGDAPHAPPASRNAEAAPAGSLFASDGDGGEEASDPLTRDTRKGDYKTVRTAEELAALVGELRAAPMVAIDTETTGLSPMRCELCGLSFSIRKGHGWYVPVRAPEGEAHLGVDEALAALRGVIEDEAIPKCGHNLKFDLLVLRRAGVELRGIALDTMIGAFLVDSSRASFSMDNLALSLLGHECTPISALIGRGASQKTFDEVPLEHAGPYAAEDTDITLELCALLTPQLKAMGLVKLCADVETPLLEVLAEMEWNGVRVDPDVLDAQTERLVARIEELKAQIQEAAPRPFNPDSPKQLAGVLFNKPDDPEAPGLGVKPRKKTKTGYSTDIEVLEALAADPDVESAVPALIVEHRQLAKLVSTYLVALKREINPETGRVHTSFHQTGASTGRLSSSDPNLQNIPIRTPIGRDIRRAFIAEEGCLLIGADYSQIELRMLAHLSEDEALIDAFEAGEDIHRAVAAQIHGVAPADVTDEQRGGAKMVNFGIIYGITAFGLARRLGVKNAEAQAIIDGYKARFTGIDAFLAECVEKAKKIGYVETILGRRRAVAGIESRNPHQRSLAERVAINSVVQGSAADLIKLAMLDLHMRLSPHAHPHEAHRQSKGASGGTRGGVEIEGVKMLLQIHDELVFEAPEGVAEEAKALIVERMERAMELRAPLVVDAATGRSWFEGK